MNDTDTEKKNVDTHTHTHWTNIWKVRRSGHKIKMKYRRRFHKCAPLRNACTNVYKLISPKNTLHFLCCCGGGDVSTSSASSGSSFTHTHTTGYRKKKIARDSKEFFAEFKKSPKSIKLLCNHNDARHSMALSLFTCG